MADPVSLGVTLAITAANYALTASQKIEGPRSDKSKLTTADYGQPLPNFYGTRRLDGCPVIWAEPLREVKRRRKTKGGKYNEYTYYGTWAIVIADHEIDALLGLLLDKHVAYKADGVGPISAFTMAPGEDGEFIDLTQHMTIYLGTEDQEPDPRIEATVDAALGAGSTPAYRGVAYVVFKDVPLEKFGNRIPQATAFATANATPSKPAEVVEAAIETPTGTGSVTFSPDFSRFMWTAGNEYAIYDTATRALMVTGTLGGWPVVGSVPTIGVASDGTIYTPIAPFEYDPDAEEFIPKILKYSADGLTYAGVYTEPEWWQAACQVVKDGAGNEHVGSIPVIGNEMATFDGVDLNTDGRPEQFAADGYGDIWVAGRGFSTSGDALFFNRLVDIGGHPGVASTGLVPDLPDPGGSAGNVSVVHCLAGAHWVVAWGANLYLIDDTTFAIKATEANPVDWNSSHSSFVNCPPGASSIWLGGSEISLLDLSVIRSVTFDGWTDPDGNDALDPIGEPSVIYDPINHALIAFRDSDQLSWLYLDRASGEGVTLQSIFDDVSERVGLEPGVDTDSDALAAITVHGFSWVQGSAKNIVEPLFEFYDCELRPHDFIVQGLVRGASASGQIETRYMGASAGGDREARYKIVQTLDTDLPLGIDFTFADPAMDQQPNTAHVRRGPATTDSARIISIDASTLALTIDEARQGAERLLRRKWFEAEGYETAVGRRHIGYEPGDVTTLELDGTLVAARLVTMEVGANGVIATRWERDGPAIHTLSGSAGAPGDGFEVPAIPVVGYTRGLLLDIPLVRDADDGLILYAAASPYSNDVPWPGAVFYDSELESVLEVASTDSATQGYATSALADGVTTIFDMASSVTVKLFAGELTSTTASALLDSTTANLAVIGDELVQFTTATLIAADTYTLSGFLRGRRGTEWATGTHASGERFVLVDSTVNDITMGASDIGTEETYKAVTLGAASTSSAFPIPVDYTGASAKPYSPVHIVKTQDASTGDWAITWVRRTRIGGTWSDYQDVPLGEGSEAYEVEILNGSTVVRTISASTTSAVYDASMQSADFGSTQSSISIRVYQISTTAGDGFKQAA